jgi:hypothetical protein
MMLGFWMTFITISHGSCIDPTNSIAYKIFYAMFKAPHVGALICLIVGKENMRVPMHLCQGILILEWKSLILPLS